MKKLSSRLFNNHHSDHHNDSSHSSSSSSSRRPLRSTKSENALLSAHFSPPPPTAPAQPSTTTTTSRLSLQQKIKEKLCMNFLARDLPTPPSPPLSKRSSRSSSDHEYDNDDETEAQLLDLGAPSSPVSQDVELILLDHPSASISSSSTVYSDAFLHAGDTHSQATGGHAALMMYDTSAVSLVDHDDMESFYHFRKFGNLSKKKRYPAYMHGVQLTKHQRFIANQSSNTTINIIANQQQFTEYAEIMDVVLNFVDFTSIPHEKAPPSPQLDQGQPPPPQPLIKRSTTLRPSSTPPFTDPLTAVSNQQQPQPQLQPQPQKNATLAQLQCQHEQVTQHTQHIKTEIMILEEELLLVADDDDCDWGRGRGRPSSQESIPKRIAGLEDELAAQMAQLDLLSTKIQAIEQQQQ